MKIKSLLIAGTILLAVFQQPVAAQTVTGSGTINYVPKFTGASVIGSSQIFDNGTNVGVGTASPTEKFHIYNGKLRITNAGANALTFSTPGAWHEIAASNNLQFTLGGSMNVINGGLSRFFVNSNGRVGIGGTTNPDEQLHLSTGKFKVGTSTNSLLVSNNTTYQEIAATDNLLLKASTAGMSFMTNNVLRMFVTQSGTGATWVGVNTTTPDEAFHVYNGSMKLTGTDPVHGAPNIFWGGTPSVAPNGEWALEYNTSDPTKKGMNFWRPFGATGGVGAGNYFLFLGDNGNVGVGTNNPTAKLTVHGKTLIGDPAVVNIATTWSYGLYVQNGILTSKIKVATVNGANWADYVFAPGYQLKPLTEVDQYIKQHQHLPNIPDAAEVEREGVDLLDMNIRLLEKVEELTLYLIQQEKRIRELEQKTSDK